MGLSSSKPNAPGPSSSQPSSSCRRSNSRRRSRGVLKPSSCLRSHGDYDDNGTAQASDCRGEENRNNMSCPCENKPASRRVPTESYRRNKAEQRDDRNCSTSDTEFDEWGESSFANTLSREGNTSGRAFSSRSMEPPSGFLSRFSFRPGSLSFRLTRANSLGRTKAHTSSSTNYTVSNDDEDELPSSSGNSMNRNDRPQGCDFIPACFANRSPRVRHASCSSRNSRPIPSSPDFADILHDNRGFDSDHNVVRNRSYPRVECSPDLLSPISGIRHSDRSFAAREPIEQNVQFSRTLSVGRLRDRVLRRTTVPDFGLYDLRRHREMRHSRHIRERQVSGSSEATYDSDSLVQPTSANNFLARTSIPFPDSPNHAHETPRARETRYRDLLEHRSNFLERRRRIRSQVRALQRIGSRFENLSGHERSCILSGQHRGGHCTCRNASREVNSNDDATARASISRIVMLAEALFEVLDEIHQQSVVLSSRPSVSSIGSVPAPNEVVDSLPLKIFSKLKRKPCDEVPQCYICLVEYEEGDSMRVLPCHHEFHRACVDKWLKEIHRVCPLCRGDICQLDS